MLCFTTAFKINRNVKSYEMLTDVSMEQFKRLLNRVEKTIFTAHIQVNERVIPNNILCHGSETWTLMQVP